MPEIKVEHVTKRWNKFYATDDVSMNIEDNAFIILLGPSGCGKTTILRMIAGLETPTSGRITIGDRVVFDSEMGINVPANKRKVGFLFQNYALWPNMTVYENIRFGLSNVKDVMPKIDFDARTNAQLVQILQKPDDVVRIVEDCRDKDGKVDEKRCLIKLIDAYTISMMTAKTLYGWHLEKGATDVPAKIAELKAKIEEAKQKNTLNDKFEVLKDGEVVMEERRLSKEEIDLSVRRVSRIVKIGMFMDRYPAELSGGQQQRVAIARTLAPEPTVLFMDEPLSNLDAKLRLEMRYELQRLHVETGSTFVYVTHDQMEAMTLATKIALLNNGVLQQYAVPLTIYNEPKNTFVADFVGNPSINFIEATGTQNADGSFALKLFDNTQGRFTPAEGFSLKNWRAERKAALEKAAKELKEKASKKGYVEKGNKDEVFRYNVSRIIEDETAVFEPAAMTDEDLLLGIRPEFVEISADGPLEGEIYGVMPTGMETTVKIRIDDYLVTGVVFGSDVFKIGSKVRFGFIGANVMLFDRASGERLCIGNLKTE